MPDRSKSAIRRVTRFKIQDFQRYNVDYCLRTVSQDSERCWSVATTPTHCDLVDLIHTRYCSISWYIVCLLAHIMVYWSSRYTLAQTKCSSGGRTHLSTISISGIEIPRRLALEGERLLEESSLNCELATEALHAAGRGLGGRLRGWALWPVGPPPSSSMSKSTK